MGDSCRVRDQHPPPSPTTSKPGMTREECDVDQNKNDDDTITSNNNIVSKGQGDIYDIDLNENGLITQPKNAQRLLTSYLEPIGLDVHPFLIGWYNEKVGPKFHLDYPDDTLAFVVINGPEVFEKCMLPYAKCRIEEDPDFSTDNMLDDSMQHAFTIIKSDLKEEGLQLDVIYDFELFPSRRPKVLVQTAAHVAGAVQYLRATSLPKEVQIARFSRTSNFKGVAIHPRYGGWFAIRAVAIFSSVRCPELQKPEPVQIFTDEDSVAHVIELFAYEWKTHEWRNIHRGIGQKYSEHFLKYLNMETVKRWDFVKNILDQQQPCNDINQSDNDESS